MEINPRGIVICVETDDFRLRIGPCIYDGKLDNAKIRSIIRENMLDKNVTDISYKDITDICVIASDSESHLIYNPKPRDVWPLEFGPNFDKFFDKKGGEKK